MINITKLAVSALYDSRAYCLLKCYACIVCWYVYIAKNMLSLIFNKLNILFVKKMLKNVKNDLFCLVGIFFLTLFAA